METEKYKLKADRNKYVYVVNKLIRKSGLMVSLEKIANVLPLNECRLACGPTGIPVHPLHV